MDCNLRFPMQWDWENLMMYNSSHTESHKKQLSIEWEVEKGEGIESVVPCFSGFEGVSSGSGTHLWHTALSKSSQSTSVTSSSPEAKPCKLGSESKPEDSCSIIEFEQVKASPAVEVSVGSAESFLGLKLGKRTYFEDFCGGNNNDISAVSVKLTPSVAMKKSKSSGQSVQAPRCQVEGCDLDLSSSKDYHRKHRVCETHSKCPKVVVGGLERRFCQQCSRFHALSEFDEKKRSCRKRLSHHNARRRKPQGVFPLNPAIIYDRGQQQQQTNLLWNDLSLNTRSEQKYGWGTTSYSSTRPTQEAESGFTLSFQRGNGVEQQQQQQLVSNSNNHQSHLFSGFQNASGLSAGKSSIISFQIPGKEEYTMSSGGVNEAQDLHRALSLLSTTPSQPPRGTTKQAPTDDDPMSDAFPTLFI